MRNMHITTIVQPAALAAAASDPGVLAVDCRFDLARPQWGESEYAAGHVPGAIYAHLDRDLSGPATPASGRHPLPARDALAARFGAWGIDRTVQVVAYDQGNGLFAARLWWLLRWLGHERVAVLDGGFAAWRAAGLPVSTERPARAARHFEAGTPLEQPVTTDEVVAALGAGALGAAAPGAATGAAADATTGAAIGAESGAAGRICLVDARAADRFAGQNETIDPVAGHVPGAVNHPLGRNVDADGRFLPPHELRARWEATLAGTPPARTVTMCGSGITAAHGLLAMRLAGLPGARLYAGSWSEWIRDPARPVATG